MDTGQGNDEIGSAELLKFQQQGFVIKRSLFSHEELELIRRALHEDAAVAARSYGLADSAGGTTTITLWNNTGDDTLGVIPRLKKMATTAQRLLEGEVYHYHSKTTTKRPGGGGTWDWHQDYGYWYLNGCLRPDMLSVAIAVSEQTEANGCIRLLAKSHQCGRIDHLTYGQQTSADTQRVDLLRQQLVTVPFLAQPGDALFFHSNTLHSSSPNVSENPREVLLCAYNAASNNPAFAHHHPQYRPLDIIPDSRLLSQGFVPGGPERDFLDPANDVSIESFTARPEED